MSHSRGYWNGDMRNERAQMRSNRALISLINGMCTLVSIKPSISCILRYMILAYSYDIRYVIIGQDPYPCHLIPFFGSSYSQSSNTTDTKTTTIIGKHFNEPEDCNGVHVRNMIRENWRLIEHGYLFVNADYSKSYMRSAVEKQEIHDLMAEYIYSVCINNKKPTFNGTVIVIGLGTAAHHITAMVVERLRASGINAKDVYDGQPKQLDHKTTGHEKIGIIKPYCVLSSTTLRVFRNAAIEWYSVQGSVHQVERLLKMSSNTNEGLNTVFMTTVGSLLEKLNVHINCAPIIPIDPSEVTPDHVIAIGKHSQESTRLFYELVCALAADTSVKETITHKIIASAAAGTQFKKTTQSVVTSGAQLPITTSQPSSIVPISDQSMGSGGTKVSKFGALKSPNKSNKTKNDELTGGDKPEFGKSVGTTTTTMVKSPSVTKVTTVRPYKPMTTPKASTSNTVTKSSSKFNSIKKSKKLVPDTLIGPFPSPTPSFVEDLEKILTPTPPTVVSVPTLDVSDVGAGVVVSTKQKGSKFSNLPRVNIQMG